MSAMQFWETHFLLRGCSEGVLNCTRGFLNITHAGVALCKIAEVFTQCAMGACREIFTDSRGQLGDAFFIFSLLNPCDAAIQIRPGLIRRQLLFCADL